jgi:hypothetical protein
LVELDSARLIGFDGQTDRIAQEAVVTGHFERSGPVGRFAAPPLDANAHREPLSRVTRVGAAQRSRRQGHDQTAHDK